MTNVSFGANLGATVAFNPASDTMTFGTMAPYGIYYKASQLSFEQDGSDLIVRNGSHWVRLASVSFGSLTSSDFTFAAGGVVELDTAGNDTLNGGGDDYFDIRKGGSDTVNAGSGNNRIYAGAGLSSGDVVIGGADQDELILSGNYATTVTLGATTVTGVEVFRVEAGSTIRLALDAATISPGSDLYIDASAQLTGDLLNVDASAVTRMFSVVAGAGDDTILGGSDYDYIEGRDGSDYIATGDGDDQLFGGAGTDTLLGSDGVDYIMGGDGADTIYGGDGDDNALWGNAGDDQIYGDDGNDMILGGAGNDTLDGGNGEDVFVLTNASGQGNDQINGFNVSEDTFWIEGLGAFTGASEAGGNTTLTWANGTVQVNGVTGLTLGDWNDLRNYWYEYAPPEITSDGGGATAELEMLEGETAVTTVTAFDPNPFDMPIFEIVGGDDAALFAIDYWTGELTFLAAPDFEAPADADYDNIYEVIVQTSDGVYSDSQAISVTVEDVAERGGSSFGSSLGGWKFGGMDQRAFHQHGDFSLSTTDWLV